VISVQSITTIKANEVTDARQPTAIIINQEVLEILPAGSIGGQPFLLVDKNKNKGALIRVRRNLAPKNTVKRNAVCMKSN
jgi:hypothetical protein